MCGRFIAMRLTANFLQVRTGRGAKLCDVAGRNVGERMCSALCKEVAPDCASRQVVPLLWLTCSIRDHRFVRTS